MANMIVALVGMPAAGKSTIANHLQSRFGYKWVRTRDIVRDLGASGNIDSLQSMGTYLSTGAGAAVFCQALFDQIDPNCVNVIDAIRPVDHWQKLQKEYGARVVLVAVTASYALRNKRMIDSGRGESLQMRDTHQVEADIPALIDECSFTLVNCNHLEFRARQLVSFLDHLEAN